MWSGLPVYLPNPCVILSCDFFSEDPEEFSSDRKTGWLAMGTWSKRGAEEGREEDKDAGAPGLKVD